MYLEYKVGMIYIIAIFIFVEVSIFKRIGPLPMRSVLVDNPVLVPRETKQIRQPKPNPRL